VEDEEHVLLQCGAYDGLRRELDADVADITAEESIIDGRLVRTGGIGLLTELESHSQDVRRAQQDAEWVLSLILAGCILRADEAPIARQDEMRSAVLQRCRRYCNDVMLARRAWWTAMMAQSESETDEDSEGTD
jgi:hypothetical protein